MKTTCNCECMLYKCFKSKWKKCYCIDKNIDILNINILGIIQGHKKYALKQKNIKVNHGHLKKCTNNLSLFTYLPTYLELFNSQKIHNCPTWQHFINHYKFTWALVGHWI